MASDIGIKIANGDFYSIVKENSQDKKRLVLTTVHDKQRSVQIDLYRSASRTMADANYIGSLVLENIKPRPEGEPSIELIISSTRDGQITADALDLDSEDGERHTLNVSLQSMDDHDRDIPDFEFDSSSPPEGLLEKASEVDYEEKKEFPWLIAILAALILVAIGLVAWLFFFQGWGNSSRQPTAQTAQTQPAQSSQPTAQQTPAPATPPAATQTPPPASTTAQTPPAQTSQPTAQQTPASVTPPAATQTPPQVIQAPAQAPASSSARSRERLAPPVASYNVPAVIPREGVPYRIRYGDTLWDIAEAFYRNPWLYPRIARHNNIRNPDRIISGTTIIVPPKN